MSDWGDDRTGATSDTSDPRRWIAKGCRAPPPECWDRQRPIKQGNKPRPPKCWDRQRGIIKPTPAGNAGEIAHVPEKRFAKTMQKLCSAVPTRYGETTTQVPTIYRVPEELKRHDRDQDYRPVAVHIGGFAHMFERKKCELEEYKWCCVRQLISRHTRTRLLEPAKTDHVLLLECLESIKRLLPRIRASYLQDISTNDDEIAEMMLLDGCFILHRLLKYARRAAAKSSGDQLREDEDEDWTQEYGRCWVWQFVTRDLLLLENQIPFFVLQELFQQLRNDDKPEEQLRNDDKPEEQLRNDDKPEEQLRNDDKPEEQLRNDDKPEDQELFQQLRNDDKPKEQLRNDDKPEEHLRNDDKPEEQMRNDDKPEELLVTGGLRLFRSLRPQMMHDLPIAGDHVHHLLHLFYLSVGFPPSDVPKRSRHQLDVFLPELPQWVPCARELEEAGVRFRKRKNATSFLDISFNFRRGVLEIPPLQLYDSSSALFRNLIAFEQVYPHTRGDVSTYAVFMDCLINTPEDMRILHLRGILVNQMNGEQDASRFFSQICAQVHWSADNYLVGLMGEVSKYKDCRRHKWRAALVRNYFSNPWLVISVLAAVFLIAMTALQTFFTVYPYFKPAK